MSNPAVKVAVARIQVDNVRRQVDAQLLVDVHSQPSPVELELLRAVELQQEALESLVDRLNQHYVGGRADHPDLSR